MQSHLEFISFITVTFYRSSRGLLRLQIEQLRLQEETGLSVRLLELPATSC